MPTEMNLPILPMLTVGHSHPTRTMILRCLSIFFFLLIAAAHCFAQNNAAGTDKQFTAEILKANLFAKTAAEKNFCNYAIRKRDDGTIPPRVFYGVYQKAIAQERPRRFAYFKSGLETVCKREGIRLL